MSGNRSRPSGGTGAAATGARSDLKSLSGYASGTDRGEGHIGAAFVGTTKCAAEPDNDTGERQRLRRIALSRTSWGHCHNCGRTFETLPGAVSHARSAQHVVEGEFRSLYLYVPAGREVGR